MKFLSLLFIFLFVFGAVTAQEKASFIEGGFSATSSYRKLRDNGDPNAQGIINSRDVYEHPVPAWGVFVNYRRQLTNRLIINAGLAYEKLGYGYELDGLYSSQIGPRGTIGPPPEGLPYKFIFHDVYHIIRIPLTLEYYFCKRKRFEWYVKAGFSADFMADNYIIRRAYYTNESVKKTKYPHASFHSNTVTLSHTGGIGGEYKLTDKARIRLNLMYSQNLLPFNHDPVRLYLQWASLNVSYNYRLK